MFIFFFNYCEERLFFFLNNKMSIILKGKEDNLYEGSYKIFLSVIMRMLICLDVDYLRKF